MCMSRIGSVVQTKLLGRECGQRQLMFTPGMKGGPRSCVLPYLLLGLWEKLVNWLLDSLTLLVQMTTPTHTEDYSTTVVALWGSHTVLAIVTLFLYCSRSRIEVGLRKTCRSMSEHIPQHGIWVKNKATSRRVREILESRA